MGRVVTAVILKRSAGFRWRPRVYLWSRQRGCPGDGCLIGRAPIIARFLRWRGLGRGGAKEVEVDGFPCSWRGKERREGCRMFYGCFASEESVGRRSFILPVRWLPPAFCNRIGQRQAMIFYLLFQMSFGNEVWEVCWCWEGRKVWMIRWLNVSLIFHVSYFDILKLIGFNSSFVGVIGRKSKSIYISYLLDLLEIWIKLNCNVQFSIIIKIFMKWYLSWLIYNRGLTSGILSWYNTIEYPVIFKKFRKRSKST